MMTEESCGAVVYIKQAGETLFLLVRNKEGILGFPKGHREAGETEQETAAREIKEETGVSVSFVDGFCSEDTHPIPRTARIKHIVCFLAYYEQQTPVCQEEELSGVELLSAADAMEQFQYESSRRILREAVCFLENDQAK